MTIPENYDIIRNFIPNPNASYIPKEELEALSLLRKQKDGAILSPFKKENKINNNFHNAYISAFSHKKSYLSNELQLIVTGISFEKRLSKIQKGDCSILEEINYLYLSEKNKDMLISFNHCQKNLKIIYHNNEILIFRVQK